MHLITKDLYSKINNISKKKIIPLHNPVFDKKEMISLQNCIKSTFVSTSGKDIDLFEEKIKNFTKAKYSIAVVNGTSALFLICKTLGINSNHEVLVPSMTFIGTVNAISYCGATPHFVDSTYADMGIDFKKLDLYLSKIVQIKKNHSINKKTKKIIKFIMPVHLFGHPCNISDCLNLSKKYKLTIIEDAAEALGSYYKNMHVGTFGIAAAFSFNGNKIITTGGGGAIITNSKKIADFVRHISSTAKVKNKNLELSHDMIGYNFKLPNLNAALGCAQIDKINRFIKNKRDLFRRYKKIFKNNKFFEIFEENKISRSNYWLQALLLKKKYSHHKKQIIYEMLKKGIEVRPVWQLIHTLKPYTKTPKMNLSNSIDLQKRILTIPSSPDL
jgi:perosamine synthetase